MFNHQVAVCDCRDVCSLGAALDDSRQESSLGYVSRRAGSLMLSQITASSWECNSVCSEFDSLPSTLRGIGDGDNAEAVTTRGMSVCVGKHKDFWSC